MENGGKRLGLGFRLFLQGKGGEKDFYVCIGRCFKEVLTIFFGGEEIWRSCGGRGSFSKERARQTEDCVSIRNNITPETWWLEDDRFLLGPGIFLGAMYLIQSNSRGHVGSQRYSARCIILHSRFKSKWRSIRPTNVIGCRSFYPTTDLKYNPCFGQAQTSNPKPLMCEVHNPI